MRVIKKLVFGMAVCFCASIFFASNSMAAGRGVSDNLIKIGMIMVKTGPAAALGLPWGWGIKDAFDYANEQGGIHGRKIKLIWEDDSYQPAKAIAAFKKLIFRDKVLFITMMGGTGQTVALLDQINKYEVVNIPNGLAEEMYKPLKPYVFTLGATYLTQIRLMFDYIMHDLKAENPRIAVVYQDSEFGKKGLYAARQSAKEYGLKLASELELSLKSIDASSQVLSLKKDKVDYVITCIFVPPLITFLKTAEKFDYWPTVFGINWSTDDVVVKSCQAAAKNYIGVDFVGAWNDKEPGIEFVRKLAQKYDRKKMLTCQYINGVAIGKIFIEAMTRAGKDLTPESLKMAMETLRDFDTGGMVPLVTYTSTSHAPTKYSRLFRADLEKGYLVPLTDWRKPRHQ